MKNFSVVRDCFVVFVMAFGLFFGIMFAASSMAGEKPIDSNGYLAPTPAESLCVVMISDFTIFIMAESGSQMEQNVGAHLYKQGFGPLVDAGTEAMQAGFGADRVLPAMYKKCMAMAGGNVI